jgi:transcriptional regulator with XRE-family HTH domain
MNDSADPDIPERNQRVREFIELFRDREAREGYAQGFLHTWISSQLATVRAQRGLTQKKLGELIGTQQPGVARMERDDYGKWKLETLERAAAALDCRLKVSLETYGSLIEEIVAFTSPEYLQRPDFAHDPFVERRYAEWSKLDAPGPVGYMRRKLADWLEHGTSPEQLRKWLSGEGLPPSGDEARPADWIAQGLEGCPASESRHADDCIARMRDDLRKRGESDWTGLDLELLSLARLRPRQEFFDPLFSSYRARRNARDFQELRTHYHTAFLEALIHNQVTAGPCDETWEFCIDQRSQPKTGVYLGLKGFAYAPERPNAWGVADKGLRLVFSRYKSSSRQQYPRMVEQALTRAGEGLAQEFKAELWKVCTLVGTSEGNMRAVANYARNSGFTGEPGARLGDQILLAATVMAVPRSCAPIAA